MPHAARKKSESGYYHVVPKGIGDQLIFLDDGDRRLYLKLLSEAARANKVGVIAYCLMSNHVHLILDNPHDGLAATMKHVNERYAMHLSATTGRRGGIFVKPFWSEPIENDAYLLCAVRYTHANPEAAGICGAMAYDWSSAKDYLGRDGLADTSMVLDMLGGRNGFVEFSQAANATCMPFPGSRLKGHLHDEEAVRLATAILGFDPGKLKTLGREERTAHVRLLASRGFPVRQLTRITGLGKHEIENCL